MTTTEFLALAAMQAQASYIRADREHLPPKAFAIDAWTAAEALLDAAPESVRNILQRSELDAADRRDPHYRGHY